jgi:hypothetical protein
MTVHCRSEINFTIEKSVSPTSVSYLARSGFISSLPFLKQIILPFQSENSIMIPDLRRQLFYFRTLASGHRP